jgi:hypothetical protein
MMDALRLEEELLSVLLSALDGAGPEQKPVAVYTRRRVIQRVGDYLQAHHLKGVRHALRQADPQVTQVSDVANAWGFWHMGQLAADYRKMCGELPSATLQM